MPDDHNEQPTPKTQLTQPTKGEPIEIPIPKEDDFEKLVRRAIEDKRDASMTSGANHRDDTEGADSQ